MVKALEEWDSTNFGLLTKKGRHATPFLYPDTRPY